MLGNDYNYEDMIKACRTAFEAGVNSVKVPYLGYTRDCATVQTRTFDEWFKEFTFEKFKDFEKE